jgi:hypothetical protein
MQTKRKVQDILYFLSKAIGSNFCSFIFIVSTSWVTCFLQELLGTIGGYGWQQKPKRKQLQVLCGLCFSTFCSKFCCIDSTDIMFGCEKNSPTHFVTLLQSVCNNLYYIQLHKQQTYINWENYEEYKGAKQN